MNRRLSWSIFILLLVSITACSSNQSKIDDGLLTGKPCLAPCWNNLTPGKSTSEDVDNFLKNLSKDDWPGRENVLVQPSCKTIRITDKIGNEGNAVVFINLQEGRLSYVRSSHSHMPTIGQIVKLYGSPEFIRPLKVVGPERTFYILHVFYPNKGLSFEIQPSEKDAGRIHENMPISIIEYYPPGDLTNYYIAKWSCNLGVDGAVTTADEEIKNEIRSWPGFGKIELIETH